MTDTNLSIFIKDFFDILSKDSIKYCVLRGYEKLPYETGRDIDVFIENKKDIIKILKQIIEKLGWNYKIIRNIDGFFTFICFTYDKENIDVIQLDFWTSLNWRGIPWCDGLLILNNELRNVNGIKVISEAGEAVVTSLKEIIGKGKVKTKYYKLIQDYSLKNKDEFIRYLFPYLGTISVDIWENCSTANFKSLNLMERRIKFKLIRKKPFCYLKTTVFKMKIKINNYFKPKGKVVAFLGPDGSGKTTIINEELSLLKPFFDGEKTYHIRYNILPELKTGRGISSMKGKVNDENNVNQQNKRSFISKLASWFVVIYYTIEFIIGNFILIHLKQKNYIILYDRYYYDHFIQPTTRNLIYKYRKILLASIKKPDIIIHLNADPDVVFKRKQELSKSEIKEQNKWISKIIKNLDKAYTIDTSSKKVNEIKIEVFNIIEKNLF